MIEVRYLTNDNVHKEKLRITGKKTWKKRSRYLHLKKNNFLLTRRRSKHQGRRENIVYTIFFSLFFGDASECDKKCS